MGFRRYFRGTLELPLQVSSSKEKSFLSCLMFCWFTSRKKGDERFLHEQREEFQNAAMPRGQKCLVHLCDREAGVKLLASMAIA